MQTQSLFEELLPEEMIALIGKYLHVEELIQLARSCRQFHRIFKPQIMQDIVSLFSFVKDGKYISMRVKVFGAPLLMLQHINHQNRYGVVERMSPLKYAFKVLDSYMWLYMYDVIAATHSGEYKIKFLQQACEQQLFTLEPLLEAYGNFLSTLKDCWIIDETIFKDWIKLMDKHRSTLPAYFFKELTRIDIYKHLDFLEDYTKPGYPPFHANVQVFNSMKDYKPMGILVRELNYYRKFLTVFYKLRKNELDRFINKLAKEIIETQKSHEAELPPPYSLPALETTSTEPANTDADACELPWPIFHYRPTEANPTSTPFWLRYHGQQQRNSYVIDADESPRVNLTI